MGDADDSYDFTGLEPFVEQLRGGARPGDGQPLPGRHRARAPCRALHRYLGNPVLSWLGRLFFKSPIGDFHCGLRGFRTDAMRELGLSTTGMEFASEMVVEAALTGCGIDRGADHARPDGRPGRPTCAAGATAGVTCASCSLYSPRWLFLYPGIVAGLDRHDRRGAAVPGEFQLGGITLGIHTFVASCMVVLIGVQSITIAAIARRYSTLRGLLPPSTRYSVLLRSLNPERLLLASLVLFLVSFLGLFWSLWQWVAVDFGPLTDQRILRVLTLSFTGLAAAFQLGLGAFLESLLEIPLRSEPRSAPDGTGQPAEIPDRHPRRNRTPPRDEGTRPLPA